MRIKINQYTKFGFCFILLTVFSCLRIYRNSVAYESTQVGGLWNIIAVFYFVLALAVVIRQRPCMKSTPIRIVTAYSCVVLVHACLSARVFSLFEIYYIITTPFFAYIILVFMDAFSSRVFENNKLVKLSYLAIFLFTLYSMVGFRLGWIQYSMIADSYYCVSLLPLVLLVVREKRFRMFAIISTGVIVMFAGKRTGFLCYAVIVLFLYLFDAKSKGIKRFKNIAMIAVVVVLFMTGYQYFAEKYGLNLLERMLNIFKDGGSGRDVIYRTILEAYTEDADLFNILFGHGRGSLEKLLVEHSAAHNDMLEILYNYGFLPCILFILFYFSMFAEWFKMRRMRYPHSGIYIGGITASLMLSLFSTYCVGFAYVICGAAFMGVALADWESFKLRERTK